MHNDDNLLQYFAVDFDEEIIGLHASDLVTKAAYVNKAIAEIISIYDKAGKGSGMPCCRLTVILVLLLS